MMLSGKKYQLATSILEIFDDYVSVDGDPNYSFSITDDVITFVSVMSGDIIGNYSVNSDCTLTPIDEAVPLILL